MRTLFRLCPRCREYTLKDECPICQAGTKVPVPPRYSPEDRYGRYRRKAIYGE